MGLEKGGSHVREDVTAVDIILKNICKAFDGKIIYDNYSAVFKQGVVTGIMAPSGEGKTTLLRMLMGIESPDSGEILGMEGMRKSAVFQEDRLCENLTAEANIRLVNPKLSPDEVREALTASGLGASLTQPVCEFSGGMRRRVAILRALLSEYDVLFLDEPFRGLDEKTKIAVIEEVKRRCGGKTVLFVTHDRKELELMQAQRYQEE